MPALLISRKLSLLTDYFSLPAHSTAAVRSTPPLMNTPFSPNFSEVGVPDDFWIASLTVSFWVLANTPVALVSCA